jgi:hypothetical protein
MSSWNPPLLKIRIPIFHRLHCPHSTAAHPNFTKNTTALKIVIIRAELGFIFLWF